MPHSSPAVHSGDSETGHATAWNAPCAWAGQVGHTAGQIQPTGHNLLTPALPSILPEFLLLLSKDLLRF